MKKKHNYLGKGIERPYDLAPKRYQINGTITKN